MNKLLIVAFAACALGAGDAMASNDVVVENARFVLTIGEDAVPKSLVVKATGEEMLVPARGRPLFSVTQERPFNNEVKLSYPNQRTTYRAKSLRREGDLMRVAFDKVQYEALVRVKATDDYVAFSLEGFDKARDAYSYMKLDCPPVAEFRLMELPVKRRAHLGGWLNVMWDDGQAVAVIASSVNELISHEKRDDGALLIADARRAVKVVGSTALLIASETPQFLDCVERAELDYGMPHGVASRRSKEIAQSTLSTFVCPTNVDEVIALARKGGFRNLHINYSSIVKEGASWSLCGNYDFREEYSNGYDDLRKVLAKIKAAGLTPGLHILMPHIGMLSRYVTPVADHRLGLTRRYTLAQALDANATAVAVEEDPSKAPVFPNLRVLKFGGELMTYAGCTKERPYRFTGIVRGAFGTRVTDHPLGEIGGILDVSEYGGSNDVGSCYLDIDTSLADEVSDKIARLYDCGMEFLYMDGAEGVKPPYGHYVALGQQKVWERLKTAPKFAQGAAKAHFSWHMLSGANAYDQFPAHRYEHDTAIYPVEGAKIMADDFSHVDFGWWGVVGPYEDVHRGTQPELWEWGFKLATAYDAPVTVSCGSYAALKAEGIPIDELLAVSKRWIEAREKGFFTQMMKERLKDTSVRHHLAVKPSGGYELVEMPRTIVLSNEYVAVTFDARGCVASIRETVTGRELVGKKVPFVSVTKKDGSTEEPVQCFKIGNNDMRFDFSSGTCRLSIKPFGGGWTFRTEEADIKDAEVLTLGRLVPACNRVKGGMSNIVMDDRSAVVLRGYVPEIDMDRVGAQGECATLDRETWVSVRREFGFVGHRYGLSAGPADRILAMLANMAEAAGMTQTGCGGPKSLTSEVNRGAYLFATWMDKESEDDWVRLMDKAGAQMFHLHAWWLTRGDYGVNPACFPGGMADLKAFVDRLHADGKRVSTHTLSAVVQFGDSHVAPRWFDDLLTAADYTLAKPYRRGDGELWVNEKPIDKHAKVLTGSTAGNILRIGDDLLQYDDFTTKPPYRFLGVHVAREPYGDVGTFDATQALGVEAAGVTADTGKMRTLSRESYPAGHAVSYLHHRYSEFVPKPGSRLAEELTDRLAEIYNTLELDGIYFDGSEAMSTRYGIDWLRERTIAKLKPRHGVIVNSASCRNPFNWWNRSLVGTWDHPTYAPRSFNDEHIRIYRDKLYADFLRTDLGWWNIHAGNELSRGYFPEEQEYVMCKTAANDMTISLQGGGPTDGPLAFAADKQITIFGKWERARYARAFRPELLKKMREGTRGFVLDQDDTGRWNLSELFYRPHRVARSDFAEWSFDMPVAGEGALRVEALYSVDREAAKTNAVRVLDASMLESLTRASAQGVRLDVAKASDSERGETIRLTATNDAADPRGAWARVSRTFELKNLFRVNPVSSLWVKGDGSGATLNVQLKAARAFGGGVSENLVVLDFTGWRKVELLLREKDAEESSHFAWPYETKVNVFMVPLTGANIESASFYLNGISCGKTATVELGAWDSLPMRRTMLKAGARVSVNGTTLSMPFDLKGAEFAELHKGVWTKYAQKGEELARMCTGETFRLAQGSNVAHYEGCCEDGFGRAEVTFFAYGVPETAFVPLSAEQRQIMKIEYEMPAMFNPSKGLEGPYPVRVRPGERASVGFEILGPVKNPIVAGRRMEVTLAGPQDRVSSYDGKTWQAIRIVPGECGPDNRTKSAKRMILCQGTFAEPLPLLDAGRTDISVSADSAEGARVTFFKRYR